MMLWVGLLTLIAAVGNTEDRTFIQFGSRVCPPCRMLQPVMDELHSEGWSIRYIDTEKDLLTAQSFGIRQTPTVIVMENGREIDRIVGLLPRSELRLRLTGSDSPAEAASSPVPQSTTPQSSSPPSAVPQKVAPPSIRSIPGIESPSASSEDPGTSAPSRSLGASRFSTLGPNHPLSRANASAKSVSNPNRRSRIDETAGDVKQAIIGVNHPLYSRYYRPPANPFASLGRQAESAAEIRTATAPVGIHPLLEGLEPLPPSPQCMAATVRIEVVRGDSKAVGTGTIIHTAGEQALVLSCAHLFQDRNDDSVINVELFAEGKVVREPAIFVEGSDDAVDLALIRFRSSLPLAKVTVLPKGELLQERDRVFSIGCDGGADPSRRESVVSKLNRYAGTSNVEAAGAPIQGRSGGGLFDEQGRLVGVCYAADNVLDEGLYVGPDAIHAQLDTLHLSWLIEGHKEASKNSVSQVE